MSVSLYLLITGCVLLAVGSAVLSGILVKQGYDTQRLSTENNQIQTGASQLESLNVFMNSTMTFMTTTTESSVRLLRYTEATRGTSFLAHPSTLCQDVNSTFMTAWFPAAISKNQMFWSITALYPAYVGPEGWNLAMAVQHYYDQHKDGSRTQYIAMPEGNGADNNSVARRVTWNEATGEAYISPTADYNFSSFAALGNMTAEDYFTQMYPWVSTDNNSYWYFTHQTAVRINGVNVIVQTMDNSLRWWDQLKAIAQPGAQIIVLDSYKMVIANTIQEDIDRLAHCSGSFFISDTSSVPCIADPADAHPVAWIRNVYQAVRTPAWENTSLPAPPPSRRVITLNGGVPYLVMTAVLYDQDELRVHAIWYQPQATLDVNTQSGLATVVILALLPTIVLALTASVVVLTPLRRLGSTMTLLTDSMIAEEASDDVPIPDFGSIFTEMQTIGEEFDTLASTCLAISKYVPRQIVRLELATKLRLDILSNEEDDATNQDDTEDGGVRAFKDADEGSIVSESTAGGRRQQSLSHPRSSVASGDEDSVSRSRRGTISRNPPSSSSIASNGTTLKRVAVICVNIRGFHEALHEMLPQYSNIVKAVETAAQKNKGVLDQFHGDRFMVSFNGMVPCAAMARGAAIASCQIVAALSDMHVTADCGVCCGQATVGQLGSKTSVRFSIISPVISQANFLMNHCRTMADGGVHILMPSTYLQEVRSSVFYFCTRSVRIMPQHPAASALGSTYGPPVNLIAIVKQRPQSSMDEWMYELEASEKANPFADINDAAELVYRNEVLAAQSRAQELEFALFGGGSNHSIMQDSCNNNYNNSVTSCGGVGFAGSVTTADPRLPLSPKSKQQVQELRVTDAEQVRVALTELHALIQQRLDWKQEDVTADVRVR